MRDKHHITALLALLLVTACHPTKRLKEGQYLVDQNKVIVEGNKPNSSELTAVTRTQPNRKIINSRFHLWLYNLADPERAEAKQQKKNTRRDHRNAKRERKGKEPKPYKKAAGNWLREIAGEPPVVLDSSKIYTSKKNLTLYLFKMGYFENSVSDSVFLDTVKRRARIRYYVKPNDPYLIDSIKFEYKDKRLFKQIEKTLTETKVHVGDRIDINTLDEERARISTALRDKGYYSFTKDYITYKLDSAKQDRKVNLTMIVNQALLKVGNGDTLIEDNHKRFIMNRIYITVDTMHSFRRSEIGYDTLMYTDKAGDIYFFLYHGRMAYKPAVLLSHIYIKPGLYYRSKEVEATYKKLSGLNTFRTVNINLYEDVSDPFQPYLDAHLFLSPMKRNIILSEASGTNRGGNLGASVNLTYKNRNIFRGAEQLSISLHGGMEAQQLLANQDEQVITGTVANILPVNTFNTIEFGPELNLSFPKFLVPFNVFRFSKYSSPKTVFNAKFNYQRRPDFSRAIQEASLSYEWNKSNELTFEDYHFHLSPLKLSAVKLPVLSDQFQANLNSIRDPLLRYSYTDHIVLGMQFGITYNRIKPTRSKDQIYIKWSIEQSGNTLYQFFKWADAKQDSIGSYEIFGIRFAHFVKTDIDFRYFHNLNKSSRMAYRLMSGVGVPLANLNEALPFEKAFYAGGANGLRGWRARTLGPGAYHDTITSFDKIGEFQLEGNLEYRFELIKVIEGAFFVDAGNVWLLKPNAGKPEGNLTPLFYQQIAMDAGIGVRLDFDFFIFRFDFAVPIREPSFPDGEKWIFQPKTILNGWRDAYNLRNPGANLRSYKIPVTVNFAIGYPF